jgi:chorismate-pyruvate lyase
MNISSEDLLNKILDASVGQVVTVLGEVLNCNIQLTVVEQNTVAANQFVRKVSITADGLPVIKANVKFDSTVLPEFIMVELLKKKRGVGTILNVHNINATRNVISLNRNTDEHKASREYEIIHNGIIWFTILEEIRLGNLGSYNNS